MCLTGASSFRDCGCCTPSVVTVATIVAISKEPLSGKDVVDVSGKIISQLLSIHTPHSRTSPLQSSSAHDGVTTAVELEAGASSPSAIHKNSARKGRAINWASAGWGFAALQ
jgi:N-acyl-D-glutamate deacylase